MATKPETFSLSDFLPYRIAVLSERISRRLSLEYGRSHGISMPEWRVLVHLARCHEASVREIHAFANLDKPRVSRTVAKLEAEGLVQKLAGREDSRLVAISLTAAGRSMLDEVIPDALAFETNLLSALSDEDLDAFDRIVEKLHGLLDADGLAPPRSGLDQEAPAD